MKIEFYSFINLRPLNFIVNIFDKVFHNTSSLKLRIHLSHFQLTRFIIITDTIGIFVAIVKYLEAENVLVIKR